ncbi:hypothetical protein EV421DRAFT_1906342 [Armillaria borealis]|uniref:Uncharacterized protein n=1 Tax=Armillaria borealis TaxID=47425 RepID=A0AA39ML94_9AGAR|nr:hypothetical protein EV421DRAFT_1906342 [Armillaria borealis]
MSHSTNNAGSRRNRFSVPRDLSPDESTPIDARPPLPLPPRPSFLHIGRSETQPLGPAMLHTPIPLHAPQPRNMESSLGDSFTHRPHPLHMQLTSRDAQRGYWYPPNLVPGYQLPIPLDPRHFPSDDSSSESGSLDGLAELFEQQDREEQRAMNPIPILEQGQQLPDPDSPRMIIITDTPPEPTISLPRLDDDPLNANGGDYVWPELANIDRRILGSQRTLAWALRQCDVDSRAGPLSGPDCPQMDNYLAEPEYSPIGNRPYTRPTLAQPSLGYETEPRRSNRASKGSYLVSPNHWATDPTSTTPTSNEIFDLFHYDPETFSSYTAESQSWSGYTAPEPYRFPDSPPRNTFR